MMETRYADRDWSELTHAYGSAEDVPAHLARLNDEDKQTRDDAFSELFGSIWHQGTVYPATVKALPELIDLFRSPDCKDRESMAILIASIADGNGYYHVHSRLDSLRKDYEKILAKRGSSIAKEIEKEADYLKVIREMSFGVLLLLEPYLDSPEAYTREVMVKLFRRYSQWIPWVYARLEKRLSIEMDEDVRREIEEALVEIKEKSKDAVR